MHPSMTYVDGFVIPLPKKRLAQYRKMAQLGARVWRDHGVLDYKECILDDVSPDVPGMPRPPAFPRLMKLKRGETLVFSYIVFRNRRHRDAVNARVMKDPRLAEGMDGPMPWDMKRFCYAGFKVLVDGKRRSSSK